MVRGLVRISLIDSLTGEEFVLQGATIKPFNIKQKKVRIGKGEEADIVKSEFAALNIVARLPEDDGGSLLAELYQFFNIQIVMNMEELQPFANAAHFEDKDEQSDRDDDAGLTEEMDEDN